MRLAAALLVLAAAAGCAEAPPKPAGAVVETVAVIPAADGHVGAVVVRGHGSEQVLDRAYLAHRVKSDGTVEAVALPGDSLKQAFADTLQALPGRPATFTLHFLEGRDELTPASREEVDKVFSELRRRPSPDILVIGHTDTVGNLAYNDKLSLARAERVRDILVGLGMDASRIRVAGRGKREPLVATDDNVNEPRNRRVEISVR
jgi:outer membrane protein OmpA-like peptidoglycan-associated protein